MLSSPCSGVAHDAGQCAISVKALSRHRACRDRASPDSSTAVRPIRICGGSRSGTSLRRCGLRKTRSPVALIGWEVLQRKAHIFIRFMADHYRPADHPNHIYVVNYKTGGGQWEPLLDKQGKPLYPLLMAELDVMKTLRPTGGLMLRRG
jgi:hypothetical protein